MVEPAAQTSSQEDSVAVATVAEPAPTPAASGEEVKPAAPKPVPLMDYILNVVSHHV